MICMSIPCLPQTGTDSNTGLLEHVAKKRSADLLPSAFQNKQMDAKLFGIEAISTGTYHEIMVPIQVGLY